MASLWASEADTRAPSPPAHASCLAGCCSSSWVYMYWPRSCPQAHCGAGKSSLVKSTYWVRRAGSRYRWPCSRYCCSMPGSTSRWRNCGSSFANRRCWASVWPPIWRSPSSTSVVFPTRCETILTPAPFRSSFSVWRSSLPCPWRARPPPGRRTPTATWP